MPIKRKSINDFELVNANVLPNGETEVTPIMATFDAIVTTESIANQFPIKNEDTSGATYDYYGYAPRGTVNSDTVWVIVRVNKNPAGASGELQRIAVSVAWDDRATATYS